MSNPIQVVAAVIRHSDRFLVCRRPLGKRHGGLFEFPGGKLLHGESLEQGIRRELTEELGITTTSVGSLLFSHLDAGEEFIIHFVEAAIVGYPRPLEHTELVWVTPAEMLALALAPSDAAFVASVLLRI